MVTDVKLLIDEDTHLVLAEALRNRGYDALHVREVGRLGRDDQAQMAFAVQQQRCFLTCNVGEFVVMHGNYMTSGRDHFGIIVTAQKPIGLMLRQILRFLQSHSASDVHSQLFFL